MGAGFVADPYGDEASTVPGAVDACREVHGVRLREGLQSRPQTVRETDTHVIIDGPIDIKLSPASARHLARTLYRLARRVEKRAEASAIEARRAETAKTDSVHESAVAQPDAQGPGA